jgi:hypothetical protein
MTIEELGKIRTKSNLKTTVNLTLVDNADFDIVKLQKYFDPKHFFIKLSPINENTTSQSNNMGTGIIQTITGVKQYIEDKSNYCINNNGKVDSVLGDVLDMSSEPADRWGRLGINQLIQGFSATALASGFYNIFRKGYEMGINIRPLIVKMYDASIRNN